MSSLIKKSQSGLTLVETTIALGILMMGIMASLTLMIASFHYVRRAEQEIVVVNLAREGIELVRSLRNNESGGGSSLFADQNYPLSFTIDRQTTDSDQALTADIVGSAASAADCGTACALYLNSQGLYVHNPSGATPTIFKRMVTLEPGATSDEKNIVSQVSWTVKGATYTYRLEGKLTNWQ